MHSGQPMSEEEVCQMIMCQYPEEDFKDDVLQAQDGHQDVPDAEVGKQKKIKPVQTGDWADWAC